MTPTNFHATMSGDLKAAVTLLDTVTSALEKYDHFASLCLRELNDYLIASGEDRRVTDIAMIHHEIRLMGEALAELRGAKTEGPKVNT